jgi:UDP-3-O-[3-hydroxymyristoyl] N-acetylglucosamine deacetylase
MLRQNGLALGGSLENAIVLGETGVLNNALRFEDEFVRHKMIDLLGDFALIGQQVLGRLVADRAGHALHTRFVGELLENASHWVIDTAAAVAVSSAQ